MGAFTDAIFAIAMTLLVVEIKRPDDSQTKSASALGHFLAHEWDSFFAFALAFVLLWGVWRRNHMLLDQVDRLTPAMAAWHGPLLLLAAFMPFSTALIGVTASNPLAVCLFAGTEAALVFCEAALKETAHRSSVLSDGADPKAIRLSASRSWAIGVFFAATALLTWWVPDMPFAWLATSLVALYGGALIERLRDRKDHSPAAADPA
jgi:uncharacterized membrane protein